MVSVKIEGKEYQIKFDFNAICNFEEATKKSFMTVLNAINKKGGIDNLQLSDIRGLLWAGLLKQNPDLTIEEVGEMINFENLIDITKAVVRAISEAFPVKEGENIDVDKKKEEQV